MADTRDLERVVKIAAPYDQSVEAEVLAESLPVYFDLGWQKVDGEDYGLYSDYPVADASTSPAFDLSEQAVTKANRSQTGAEARTSLPDNPPA